MEIRSMPQVALDPMPKAVQGSATDLTVLNESRAQVVQDSVSISTTGTLRSLQYVEKEIKANLSRLFMKEVFGSRSESISPEDLVNTSDEDQSLFAQPGTTASATSDQAAAPPSPTSEEVQEKTVTS
ncbi:MAG: hypothetical protein HQL64_09975 [Magnetococcales bacterium]|nr:hypothetical protein [Magnetococcales bacterium]